MPCLGADDLINLSASMSKKVLSLTTLQESIRKGEGNTAQFWCADCAVRIFVRLAKNRRQYYLYYRGFLGDMTEYYASKMRAVNCAVLP